MTATLLPCSLTKVHTANMELQHRTARLAILFAQATQRVTDVFAVTRAGQMDMPTSTGSSKMSTSLMVSLLLRLSHQSMHPRRRTILLAISVLFGLRWLPIVRRPRHEQFHHTTNHHCPCARSDCSVCRMLATSTPWPAIPSSLVVNALHGSCAVDQAEQETKNSPGLAPVRR